MARVVKTQGRHGEVAVELHTAVPDRLVAGFNLSALYKDESRAEFEIEDAWPHKGGMVLKLSGVDSISQAEELVGCELQVRRSERAELESGWTYISDLIGCRVFDGGREIGEVQEVRFGAGEAPLLEVRAGGRIYEIPYAGAYLVKLDLAGKRIEMVLPEGMLDLDVPLTAEEKRQQRKK